jgi:hypothetical protein
MTYAKGCKRESTYDVWKHSKIVLAYLLLLILILFKESRPIATYDVWKHSKLVFEGHCFVWHVQVLSFFFKQLS